MVFLAVLCVACLGLRWYSEKTGRTFREMLSSVPGIGERFQEDPAETGGVSAGSSVIPPEASSVSDGGSSDSAPETTDSQEQEKPGAGQFGVMTGDEGYYAYLQLDETDRSVYDRILSSIENREEVSFLESEADGDDIGRIFQCVLSDHPEIFYTTSYVCVKRTHSLFPTTYRFLAKYDYSEEETESHRAQIEQISSQILSALAADADDYTKAKYVYEYIVGHTEYDSSAENNQNLLSVFENGRSVCAGYSKATEYLFQKLGIRCGIVYGTATDESGTSDHAWNAVFLDGAYYYVDSTFGDPVVSDNSGYDRGVDYNYLCVTTEDILKDHTIDETRMKAPECTAVDDNYYRREGAYFTSYDRNQLASLFSRMFESGAKNLSIRCSDETVYREMYDDLVDNGAIFHYLQGRDRYGTTTNSQLYSITFAVN
ncbi:MAG: transglutaminase domain-containing protein [Bilifractor sp.]